MIKLVGTIHSHVRAQPELLRTVASSYRFDHLFTEGISDDVFKAAINDKKLYQQVKDQTDEKVFEQKTFDFGRKHARQGPEVEQVQHEIGTINLEEVTFLDNDRALDQITYLIKEGLENEQNIENTQNTAYAELDPRILKHKIKEGSDTREDYIQYFRSLQNEYNFNYSAISDPELFEDYKQEISTDFQPKVDEKLAKTLDLEDQAQEKFLEAFNEYGFNRFTFQDIIHETRAHNMQNGRDRDWYKQITNYCEENPEDNILVFCGLNHLTRNENTLRYRLEQAGYEDEIYVKPLDQPIFSP